MESREVGSIFIEKIEFDLEVLTVYLGNGQNNIGRIEFYQPRAFQFFTESDNYKYLESIGLSQSMLMAQDGSGLITTKMSRYLDRYRDCTPKARLDAENYSCLVVTAQECIEVVVFEDPKIYLD
jgi:hypothetical protein